MKNDADVKREKYDGIPFTEEEYAYALKVLRSVKELPEKLVEEDEERTLSARIVRWISEQTDQYYKNPALEMHDAHQGYTYIIRNPFIEGEKNIIFVGCSVTPHEAVKQHLESSHIPKVRKYMRKMLSTGDQFCVRGLEVVDLFEGLIDDFSDYPVPEGVIEIPWEVIAYDMYHTQRAQPKNVHGIRTIGDSTREYFTSYYRALGHPLLNGQIGRPPAKNK